MRITLVKPAAAMTVQNAFRRAAVQMFGEVHHATVDTYSYGEMHLDFSGGAEIPRVTHAGGDSVLIVNSKGKRARLWFVHPRDDVKLYTYCEILVEGIGKDAEYDRVLAFRKTIEEFTTLMNKHVIRLSKYPVKIKKAKRMK